MTRGSIVLLSTVLLLSTILGGCVGGEDKDADPSTSSSPSDAPGTSPSPGTEPVADGNNTAPTLTFTPSIANGSAPANITFTLDASDAEEDNLTWSVDANGDGEADGNGTDDDLPAEFNFTYEAAGLYNATFDVSDGTNAVNETIAVTVTAGGAFTDLLFTGTISGLWVGGAGGVSEYLPPDAGEEHTFDLTASPTSITLTLTWDGMQGFDIDFYVYDEAGNEVARGAEIQDPGADSEPVVTITDPEILSRLGTWSITLLSAGSYECDYELIVDFA